MAPHDGATARRGERRDEQPVIAACDRAGDRAGSEPAEAIGHEPFPGDETFPGVAAPAPRHDARLWCFTEEFDGHGRNEALRSGQRMKAASAGSVQPFLFAAGPCRGRRNGALRWRRAFSSVEVGWGGSGQSRRLRLQIDDTSRRFAIGGSRSSRRGRFSPNELKECKRKECVPRSAPSTVPRSWGEKFTPFRRTPTRPRTGRFFANPVSLPPQRQREPAAGRSEE